jgi:hypothetical protein
MVPLIRAIIKPIVSLGKALERLDRFWDSLISGATHLVLWLAKLGRAIDDKVIDGFLLLVLSLIRRLTLLVHRARRPG